MSDFNHASLEKQNWTPAEKEPSPLQHFVSDLWAPKDHSSAQGGGAAKLESAKSSQPQPGTSQSEFAHIPQLPDSQVLTNFKSIPTDQLKTELTAKVTVTEILPDFFNPRNGLKHEQFIVQTDDGQKEFVAHDLNFADRVPLTVGEQIQLRGEYIPTPGGEHQHNTDTITTGVLHWTHESENEDKHPSGYILADGIKYDHKTDDSKAKN